ncbi:fractalkine [Perognathus longimembris pacificus]|uniref:fractalkine n=1 Tax=Perognathus longimembris pacificus TaxID=214514 RepID=UPI0020189582|nr:fractalkine [Perognathus longimembris pacificus]
MAPRPLPWLLRLAALCHLTALLAGQHLGVTKCNITCHKMTPRIPVNLLIHYRQNQESCGKRAIILETRLHRLFCANPEEQWVQEAMKHLDRRAAALSQNGGTFEKQIGVVKPGATPTFREPPRPAVAEPDSATGESRSSEMTASSQEEWRPTGTSPELLVEMTTSLGTRWPPASEAHDGGPIGGPEGTEIFHTGAMSTTMEWQGSGLRVEAPSPQASSTQAPSTQAPSIQTPTISQLAPEENVGSVGQPGWVQEQSPSPENSLESEEMGPAPAHTNVFQDWGPGSMAHPSVVPSSAEGTPSREPVASGSWAPKAEEPIHATADPQRLSVLMTPVPDSQAATRRQAVGLLAFLGLLFCLGVAMFAYQSLQGCPRKMAGEMIEGLRYVPRSCGSNSYVLVPV